MTKNNTTLLRPITWMPNGPGRLKIVYVGPPIEVRVCNPCNVAENGIAYEAGSLQLEIGGPKIDLWHIAGVDGHPLIEVNEEGEV